MPVDCGSITPNRAHAATAASAAVPPERMTSIAVSAASGCDVATIAFWAWTVDRPARWKFLMPNCSLYHCYSALAEFRRGLTWHIHEALGNALGQQPIYVVPAKAGTHDHRCLLLLARKLAPSSSPEDTAYRWPPFAGTTLYMLIPCPRS